MQEIGEDLARVREPKREMPDAATALIYIRHKMGELSRELVMGLCYCCSFLSTVDRQTPRCGRCQIREGRTDLPLPDDEPSSDGAAGCA
jgi:hypothetical protein